jgi:GNAT superfamily N-acetyltransferase
MSHPVPPGGVFAPLHRQGVSERRSRRHYGGPARPTASRRLAFPCAALAASADCGSPPALGSAIIGGGDAGKVDAMTAGDGAKANLGTLRRGRAADAAAIRSLTRAAYAKWIPVVGREPKPMSADYDAAVLLHRFDLLHVEGELAALIETVDEGDQLLIENVAVAPGFQGRGLGGRLLAQAETAAPDLGYRRIRLYTNQRFTENLQIYVRLGYRVDSEDPIDGGLVRVNMSKALGDV